MPARRSFWGWGHEGAGPNEEQALGIARTLAARFAQPDLRLAPAPRLEDLRLPAPRVAAPAALAALVSDAPYERASHSYGKSYRDIVRGARGEFPHPPDLVAFPRSEADVVALLDWCTSARIAAIAYGGGSSVVGGVEPRELGPLRGAVSIDLSRLDRVLEIDAHSRAARIQAGI